MNPWPGIILVGLIACLTMMTIWMLVDQQREFRRDEEAEWEPDFLMVDDDRIDT